MWKVATKHGSWTLRWCYIVKEEQEVALECDLDRRRNLEEVVHELS
jgi:hypothetical protein